MTKQELYERIGLSPRFAAAAEEAARGLEVPSDPCRKLFSRETCEEGLAELQAALGEDPFGLKLFVCLAGCALHSHALYRERGIPDAVFDDTMKFLSRFAAFDSALCGRPAFRRGWWFPRQLGLREFRIGALEYEMTEEEGEGRLSLHIPSDADLSLPALNASKEQARRFFAAWFPDCAAAGMYCESWLLSPALPPLLPPGSRIAAFRRNFTILRTDEASRGFMDWLFPEVAPGTPAEDLPEDTSLRRGVKRHLLAGGTVGWTLGRLNEDAYR